MYFTHGDAGFKNVKWTSRDLSNFVPQFQAWTPASALYPAIFALKFSGTSTPQRCDPL
jgi:hypothetical protein